MAADPQAALAHCETCDRCRTFFHLERLVAMRVHAAAALAPAAGDRLRDRIREALDTEDHRRRSRSFRRRLTVAGSLAAAAIVLSVSVRDTRVDPVQGLVETATSVGDGPQLPSSDPRHIRRWLESRVGYELEIPAITNAQLTGGRAVTLNGTTTAAVTYVLDGKPLVYFAMPSGTGPGAVVTDERVRTAAVGGYHIATWMEDGAGRAIVAPIPKGAVRAVAEECRRKAAAAF